MARRQSADPLERYDTPAWCTRALVLHGPVMNGWKVIEPMAGCYAMGEVLEQAGCVVSAFDIAPRDPRVMQADTMTPGFFEQMYGKVDPAEISVITNPPFSLAAGLARRVSWFRRVALLVRITWLEKTKDRDSIADPVRVIVLPRPKFTGKGSDSTTVVWACWGDWEPGIVRLGHSDRATLQAMRGLTNTSHQGALAEIAS